jgi:hypothetical protein
VCSDCQKEVDKKFKSDKCPICLKKVDIKEPVNDSSEEEEEEESSPEEVIESKSRSPRPEISEHTNSASNRIGILHN